MFVNTFGKYKNCECGLVNLRNAKFYPIPLASVSVDVIWLDACIKVTLTQTYKNKETKPVETQYVFPMDDRAAICGFQAEIEGRKIQGQVRKKEEARHIYEESVKQGQTAFLVEETKPDIFQAKIGNLQAGSVATITLTYVTEATAEGNALRFFLPTTIAPRYIPQSDTSEAAKVIGDIDYSIFSPCPLEIQVHIETGQKVLSINSPTHEINILSKNEVTSGRKLFKADVQLRGGSMDMDRDFVLLLETDVPHQPRLILEKSADSTIAALITLVPSFKLPPLKCDFIFVIDRSGSMSGGKMEKAKNALQLFLKSLPLDSYFNIVSFGSTFSSLWEGSRKYEEGSLQEATAHVLEMTANYGGTEIYEPLYSIFHQVQRDDYTRQVIVLTDGEVSNTEQVIALVRESCKTNKTRVFALGVGSDASHHLVNGIALAGKGEALFTTLKEGLSGKVQHLLKNSLQPSLASVKVNWAHPEAFSKQEDGHEAVVTDEILLGYGKHAAKKHNSLPDVEEEIDDPCISVKNFPCIFDGSCYAAYCIYNNPRVIPAAITLCADAPIGPLSITFPVVLEEVALGGIVHTLAAKSIIRELEEEILFQWLHPDEQSKKERAVVYLGMKYNIASSFTSFVAFDEGGVLQKDVPLFRTVPNMIPHGWAGRGNVGLSGPQQAKFDSLHEDLAGFFARDCKLSDVAPKFSEQSSFFLSSRNRQRKCHLPQWSDITERVSSFFSTRSSTYCAAPSDYSVVGPMNRCEVSINSASVTTGSAKKESGGRFTEGFADFRECEQANDEAEALRCIHKDGDMSTDEGKLQILTAFQCFDGSFPADQQFFKLIGLSEHEFSKERDENKCGDSELATALAVTFMEMKLSAYKDHWELMVKKSRTWLEGKGASHLTERVKHLLH